LAADRFRAYPRGSVRKGTFRRRLNRFVVEAELEGKPVLAHLPNPGRLWEILFPETELALLPTPGSPVLAYKAVAARRNGRWICLDTIRTNALARHLLEREAVSGLKGWEVLESEVQHGNSRFDFLLGLGFGRMFLEVKSCTLFQGPMAMFPDAVTERGRRHLLELASLGEKPARGALLVISQGPETCFFLPDYHTDPAFARTFLETRGRLDVFAVTAGWNEDLFLQEETVRPLEIPWQILEGTDLDAGAWILILQAGGNPPDLPSSVETGVEESGLDRKMKALAREYRAFSAKVLPIRGYRKGRSLLEEALACSADGWEKSAGRGGGRIFRFGRHPLSVPAFVETLLNFRLILQPLGKML
jgi:sugar fermentation stimulation protein A